MSTINAATSGQVRYVATLALRAGHVPALSSLLQPTLSKPQAQQLKVKFTKTVLAACTGSNGQLEATPHQVQVLDHMASISKVAIGNPPSRLVADQWQIAWFKKASAREVALLLAHMQPAGQYVPEHIAKWALLSQGSPIYSNPPAA